MASSDLRNFLTDRLLSLDPTIDLSPGSPALLEFVEPVLSYLGTDPFDTDIDSFLTDRLRQEFPDIYSGDPSAVRDLFIKPLILFLEPFKREIQSIKRNQSLRDPTMLSDDDADALIANVFDTRSKGGYATGVVRVYYANPSNVPVGITVQFLTSGGLNFFPVNPMSITAEEMVFNRQGNLYFADIPVRAEMPGDAYNISPEQIVSVQGLYNTVKVTNLRPFSNGSTAIDTPSFVAQARESLNERSINTRRGANARIRDVFQGEIRAIQVIGARDAEMQRDVLVGESTGQAWLTGQVTLYDTLALVQARTIDDSSEALPSPGDKVYVYLDELRWPNLLQPQRFVRLKIEEVLTPGFQGAAGFQLAVLVRWSGDLPPGVVLPIVAEGGAIRRGAITVSSLPGAKLASPVTVMDGEVHLYGHTDIYARPTTQVTTTAVLSNVGDETPLLSRHGLATTADLFVVQDIISTNPVDPSQVTDSFDFLAAGVRPWDILTIEFGDNAGTYLIGRVTGNVYSGGLLQTPSRLYLISPFNKAAQELRYRISRSMTISQFDPKIPKLPFANTIADDLQTVIGSNLFRFDINTVDFGVAEGDVVRIKSGLDQGDFTITGFDNELGGRGVLVDRRAGSSAANLSYEIFRPLEMVKRPLVRIQEMLLLDSSNNSTGVTIPPADPVAVCPTSDFTTAQLAGHSNLASGYVLPAMGGLYDDISVAANANPGSDRRYSMGFDQDEDGVYKAMHFADGTEAELLIPPDADTCSYFLTTIEDTASPLPPYEDPRPGESLTLKSGPNKGSYIIKSVRKFRYSTGTGGSKKSYTIFFIKIHGTFPVDPFKQLIAFLDDHGAPVSKLTGSSAFQFPGFFDSFYSDPVDGLAAKLQYALGVIGTATPGLASIQTAIDSLLKTSYEWGTPARGVMRTYFYKPTLFQQNTAQSDNPTLYRYKTAAGEEVLFRAHPDLYARHTIIPAKLSSELDPIEYPRDLSNAGSTVDFSMSDMPSVFALGVETGDVVSIHEEVLLLNGDPGVMCGVQTLQDSPRVTLPQGAAFGQYMVGNLLSIEEGPDKGMYRITDYVDSKTVILDRALTSSTPSVLMMGTTGSWGYKVVGSNPVTQKNVLTDPNALFTEMAERWITIYGVPADTDSWYLQGSYRIKSVIDATTVELDMGNAPDLPAWPANFPIPPDTTPVSPAGTVLWVITAAPTVAPTSDENTAGVDAQHGQGTELVGVRPFRVYRDVPTDYPITAVTIDPSVSRVTVDGTTALGHKQPYRIYRNNLRRIPPAEMRDNEEGMFFYFDTEVVSLSSSPAANVPKNSYLTVVEGTYESQGYRHVVDDPTLSYSMQESGSIVMPHRITPVFAADRKDNELSIVGSPLQISYERADVVEQLQNFIQSTEDRVSSANMLARHFLPSYVTYDASYSGGSAPSVIATDIINYINNLPIETPIDVSKVQDLIARRGGNPDTPTKVAIVIHDWDRRMWVEFSEDFVGGLYTKVPYNGTPRVSYFVPGKDVSGQSPLPSGERVNLVRR